MTSLPSSYACMTSLKVALEGFFPACTKSFRQIMMLLYAETISRPCSLRNSFERFWILFKLVCIFVPEHWDVIFLQRLVGDLSTYPFKAIFRYVPKYWMLLLRECCEDFLYRDFETADGGHCYETGI